MEPKDGILIFLYYLCGLDIKLSQNIIVTVSPVILTVIPLSGLLSELPSDPWNEDPPDCYMTGSVSSVSGYFLFQMPGGGRNCLSGDYPTICRRREECYQKKMNFSPRNEWNYSLHEWNSFLFIGIVYMRSLYKTRSIIYTIGGFLFLWIPITKCDMRSGWGGVIHSLFLYGDWTIHTHTDQ